MRVYQFRHLGKHRAENEARTRDPNLGKVVLYQLSYFRIESEEEETRTPTPRGTATSKQRVYHSATSPFLNHKVCGAQDRSRTCTPLDTRT